MVSQAHLDAFDRADRVTQDKQFKCKKGVPCNGRCLPRGQKCRGLQSGAGQDRDAIAQKRQGGLAQEIGRRAAIVGGLGLALGGAANVANRQAVRQYRHNVSKAAHEAKQTEAEFQANKAKGLETGESSQKAKVMKAQVKQGREQLKQHLKQSREVRSNPLTPMGLSHAVGQTIRTGRRAVYQAMNGSLEERAAAGKAARSAESAAARAKANRPMKSAAPKDKQLAAAK